MLIPSISLVNSSPFSFSSSFSFSPTPLLRALSLALFLAASFSFLAAASSRRLASSSYSEKKNISLDPTFKYARRSLQRRHWSSSRPSSLLALLLSLVDTHGAGGERGGAALGAQVDIVDDLNHN